jgi:F-type H+-transporting ATPase subunit a
MILIWLQKLALMAPVWIQTMIIATGSEHAVDTLAEHGAEAAESGPPELPSLISMLFSHDSFWHHWVNVIYGFAVALMFIAVSLIVYRKRQIIPGPLQNFMEILVEGMYNFIYSILGKDAKKYTPYLGTLFFYILVNNFIGMIPFGHSPSTSVNITASLAIMTFLYAQWAGISRLGPLGYLDHLAGEPRDVISWCLVPLMFPMHIIGEIAKPFSLAIRLFGNITGEDVLIAAFVGLGVSALSFIHSPVGIPFGVPFIFLGILLSTIQALVFTLLSTIYILMMLPHEEGHEH